MKTGTKTNRDESTPETGVWLGSLTYAGSCLTREATAKLRFAEMLDVGQLPVDTFGLAGIVNFWERELKSSRFIDRRSVNGGGNLLVVMNGLSTKRLTVFSVLI